MPAAASATTTRPRKVPELLIAINRCAMNSWGIARAANIHPVRLSRVLNRHQKLDAGEAERLAKVLGVAVRDLGDVVQG
jgi:plasmid maintenance system antidote protein VapI